MINMNIEHINECRVCKNKKLIPILSLNEQFVSDFIAEDNKECSKIPLELLLCDSKSGGCGLLQLKHNTPPGMMYNQYWYKSGISITIKSDLKSIVDSIEKLSHLKSDDIVVDIGCNDGTLLRFYNNTNLIRVGFEPALNLMKDAEVGTSKIINNFFNYKDFQNVFGDKKAKAITAISMFYDLEDPNKFLNDISKILDHDGIFVIQQNYLVSMLEQNAFDNICHEHLEYYSLFSMENLMKRHNMEIFDVETNDINGGSFRTYIKFKDNHSTQGFSGADERLEKMRKKEKELGLDDKKIYQEFAERVKKNKEELCKFMKSEVENGKKIYIYGASTRGNVTLQFYEIDKSLVTAATDKNPDKWGRKIVCSLIPIISIDQYRKDNPDYLLVLPWHFFEEIKEQEKDYFDAGGKFIVPLPKFRVVQK
jgi:NDP-4-keto-2,6-dideoxyhexose 3-C-methyltransferase